MAAATRPSSAIGSIAAAIAALVVGLPVGIILLLGGGSGCAADGAAAGPDPSSAAQQGIPRNYLRIYQQAGKAYGIPWNLLAGIGQVETNHGRLNAPGVTSGLNSFGCCAGPMQFNLKNGPPSTWDAYKTDGNRDGRADIYNPEDAIFAAAKYLKALGAPGDLEKAVFGYNHSSAYVAQVFGHMRRFGGQDTASLAAPDNTAGVAGACADGGGLTSGDGDGRYRVAPGANRAGVPITRLLDDFITRMATFYAGDLVLTTGTNHSRLSASGLVSDHWVGNGADFGMALNGGTNNGPVGDRIAAAAWLAAGLPRDIAIAKARRGGLQNVVVNGVRVQVIWKNYPGHADHAHVGIRREG